MFERFTDESRRVVVYAQEESRARADGYIGSAHLLLGLLHIGDATTRVATDAGLTITRGREWLGEHRGRRHPGSVSGHIPFTAEAKRILEEALRVSDESGLWAIDTADLLLGLLAVPDTTARRLLDGLGVDSPRLRARLRALPRTTTILGPAARGTAAGPAEPVFETGRLVAALLREFPESPTTTWVGT
jgi:ATP-dependent Clp protease ATP-binding subunit ClpC